MQICFSISENWCKNKVNDRIGTSGQMAVYGDRGNKRSSNLHNDLPVFTLITHPKWDPLIPLIFERTIFFDFARWYMQICHTTCFCYCISKTKNEFHENPEENIILIGSGQYTKILSGCTNKDK
jgi:hypothetical protein